ncbi:caspase family protein [Bradyrhizobium sp. 21]|uniref:caspase family protein n=1 Tax=Bradyrhizobium sp. 21 TaxID=2782666 RepID=UPI0023EEB877|nr:caspase family protein [Bradyrhizobium sp. 21]MCK1385608.1 caspase family protein [Bradyrhizobium sp. 21]
MVGLIPPAPTSRLHRLAGRVALAVALMLAAATHAQADKRVALVLAVSNYQSVARLANPDNDAAAISTVFKQMGFDSVELRRDLGASEMRRAVREFAAVAADSDMAVVYYAGHGIEVNGANFLIPADARLQSDFDVEDETVPLDRILQAINPAKRLRLVILDACRDNPFAERMTRSVATRSMGRGLAKIEPATADTLIAFAAKAGAVAGDGDGAHSPFATALLNHLATPGLDLRLTLGRVRDEVLKSTGRRQEPFVYGSLGGDTVALVPLAAPPVDPDAEARRDYEFAAQIGTREAWTSFLGVHGSGIYANSAHAALDRLGAAEKASEKADQLKRQAEEQARRKSDDLKRQIEEQAARQAEQAKLQVSEQARRDLEKERQRIADQAKRDLDDARRQVAEARRQAEDAAVQVEQAKKQAALDAQQQIEAARREQERRERERQSALAALTPPAAPAPASVLAPAPVVVPVMDPADVARLLQAHLRRVGCDPGAADGAWSAPSQKALDNFNRNAGTKFDVKVASLDALDAVRARPDRVCPLLCAGGQKVEGDRCVQIVCDGNDVLDAQGVCRRRPDPPPQKPKAVSRQEPKAVSRQEPKAVSRQEPSPRGRARPSGGADSCGGSCEGD